MAYDWVELLAWTERTWPWIAEEPDARMWAREFAEITRAEVRLECTGGGGA
jgi:hypothetical protein